MSFEIIPVGALIADQALSDSGVEINVTDQTDFAGSKMAEVVSDITETAKEMTGNRATEAKIVADALERIGEQTGREFDVRLFLNGVVASCARDEHRRRNPRSPKYRI